MKLYLLCNSGVEHNEILGIYESREMAEKDLDYIGEEEAKDAAANLCDDTFQMRWVKMDGVWYEQSRHKSNDEEWGPWPEHDRSACWYGTRIRIEEYETRTMSLKDQADTINEYQNPTKGMIRFHPLTCGHDSNHPNLVPYYVSYPVHGVGIKCIQPDCDWRQNPDDPILGIIYAAFLRDRTQTS